ncbi:MAG: radical SAM family heme chaperone HemW [Gammaproteobacteria bacterium]|jgi:oxygen-independent coproporphyrinogen-3 oxidase|nr:radical SAM family heme chaperone HemW [Gammaproteobacteria bacterium]
MVRIRPPVMAQIPDFKAPPPLSLYIHVPWCTRKCPYCDFNSHEPRGDIPESEYIAALVADLEHDLPRVWGRPVETVFIGGGTPSLLRPESVDRLLSEVRARVPLRPGAEITLEANPGTVDQARLTELKAAGINRLSIGVQSLDDELLRRIGRIHDATAARSAAEGAIAAGFDNWNIDLMYGLPGQSVAGAQADLRAALALGAPHVSHYQLTIEPNTAFHHAPPATADDDALWEMQEHCRELFATAGYDQYEVSAWARPGHRCEHNLNYWLFGDYLGIGAGAHAKITVVSSQSVERCSRLRSPRDYLAGEGATRIAERRRLETAADLGLEFMMNALRLSAGFHRRVFEEHAGIPLMLFERELARAEALGLIERDHLRIWPTERGRRYLNELLMLFMAADQLA